MSGASWEPDPKLTRPRHAWVYQSHTVQEWGLSVTFSCSNSGCPTTSTVPLHYPEHMGGICFDRVNAIQLTDREGNKIR